MSLELTLGCVKVRYKWLVEFQVLAKTIASTSSLTTNATTYRLYKWLTKFFFLALLARPEVIFYKVCSTKVDLLVLLIPHLNQP
jgi:hypothetical protein